MKATDIAAYMYQAELLCPECTALTIEVDHPSPAWLTPEQILDRVAKVIGLDRRDERSFDSNEFPKVVFADQICSDGDICIQCGNSLLR